MLEEGLINRYKLFCLRHEDTKEVEKSIMDKIHKLVKSEILYSLGLDNLCNLFKNSNQIIDSETAKTVLSRCYLTYGFNSIKLLRYINCGSIGYMKAANICSCFREIPLLKELCDVTNNGSKPANYHEDLETTGTDWEEEYRKQIKKNDILETQLNAVLNYKPEPTLPVINLDSQYEEELRPYFVASERGYVTKLRQALIKNPKLVQVKNRSDWMLLHSAVYNNQYEVVDLLLDFGADPNAIGPSNNTPLHYAAQYGLMDIARLLVESDANLNARSKGGWTPLMKAAKWNKMDMVLYLYNHGASPIEVNDWGETAESQASLNEIKSFIRQKGKEYRSKLLHFNNIKKRKYFKPSDIEDYI